jgi:GAF domain-containing protein
VIEQMTSRLLAAKNLAAAVDRIMTDVIALHGAEFGDIQLVTPRGLALVGQLGFDAGFVSTFLLVESCVGTVCARAYRERRPIIVQDVETDQDFAPFRAAARRSGFRAAQSTPLITSREAVIGVVSTHFAHAYEPTPIEMAILADYSRIAADYCQQFLDRSGQKLAQDLCVAFARRLGVTLPAELEEDSDAPEVRASRLSQAPADVIPPPT